MVRAASQARGDAGHWGDDGEGRGDLEQGVGEAPPILALPAHGRSPNEMGHDPRRTADAPRRRPGGEQGAEEAAPALALPAHGRGPEKGAEEAAPDLALPAYSQGPKEKGMAHAALRTHRDAGHGGDEEGARACRAQPVGEREPGVDLIQASAADVPNSAGEADRPRRMTTSD